MKKTKRKIVLVVLIVFFAVFNFSRFDLLPANADTEAEKTQDEINDLEKDLKKEEAALAAEESKLYKNQAQISTTNSRINKIKADIARKEAELANLNARAELNKKLLAEYIRQIYYANQDSNLLIELAMYKGNLSDMVANPDSMINIKAKIADALQIINDAKIETMQTKDELADQKQENQKILQSQQVLQNQIAGEVQERQATVAEIQKKISKLRSTLSSFLGKSFSMDDVINAVKYAEKKTGVRKEFLFAVLDKETDLGRFTGGCTYKKSKMGDTNLKYFKEICSDLGYDYSKMKVSCALSYGIGGAMGVAQFMPSTWMGYKDAISQKTGNNPADPWSLKDGIMGMALYLKNKGGDKKSGEYQAAAMYYCGGNWKRTVCRNYANTVISWSKGYDEYF